MYNSLLIYASFKATSIIEVGIKKICCETTMMQYDGVVRV
jgi:hypothetical protein